MLSDPNDIASELEEHYREQALHRAKTVAQEEPDEDLDGTRYCLDCGVIIPELRIKAVNAVRCVECATRKERMQKLQGK